MKFLKFIIPLILLTLSTLNASWTPPNQSTTPWNNPLYRSLTPQNLEALQEIVSNGNAIINYTNQRFQNPTHSPSPDFLNLNPNLQYGARQAVSILEELFPKIENEEEIESFSASEESSNEDDLDRLLDETLTEFEEEERGRSTRKEKRERSHCRSLSPLPFDDTSYMKTASFLEESVLECYAAKERLTLHNFNPDDIAPTLGAYAIDGIILVNDTLDTITFGGWSSITEGIDDLAKGIQTYVRRGTRYLSGDQRASQELGEGVYVVLSLAGGKGLKNVKFVQKTTDQVKNLSRVRKINDKPLLGKNPRPSNHRISTDVDPFHDRATAKSIFRNQTKGQKVITKKENGNLRRFTSDGKQIRFKKDGTTRIDLPGRGSKKNGESMHFNGAKGK